MKLKWAIKDESEACSPSVSRKKLLRRRYNKHYAEQVRITAEYLNSFVSICARLIEKHFVKENSLRVFKLMLSSL